NLVLKVMVLKLPPHTSNQIAPGAKRINYLLVSLNPLNAVPSENFMPFKYMFLPLTGFFYSNTSPVVLFLTVNTSGVSNNPIVISKNINSGSTKTFPPLYIVKTCLSDVYFSLGLRIVPISWGEKEA